MMANKLESESAEHQVSYSHETAWHMTQKAQQRPSYKIFASVLTDKFSNKLQGVRMSTPLAMQATVCLLSRCLSSWIKPRYLLLHQQEETLELQEAAER